MRVQIWLKIGLILKRKWGDEGREGQGGGGWTNRHIDRETDTNIFTNRQTVCVCVCVCVCV